MLRVDASRLSLKTNNSSCPQARNRGGNEFYGERASTDGFNSKRRQSISWNKNESISKIWSKCDILTLTLTLTLILTLTLTRALFRHTNRPEKKVSWAARHKDDREARWREWFDDVPTIPFAYECGVGNECTCGII